VNLQTRFKTIANNLSHQEYTHAAYESIKIIEIAFRKLLVDGLARLSDKNRLIVMQAILDIGKGDKGVEEFGLGQILGVLRKSNFYSAWEESTGKDLSAIRIINFDALNNIRIKIIHAGGEATEFEAELLFQAVRGVTQAFGIMSLEAQEQDNDSSKQIIIKSNAYKKSERIKNVYDARGKEEKRRLKIQQELTRKEDVKVVSELIRGRENINIFDVGCNNGDYIIDRLTHIGIKESISNFIGVDVDEQLIKDAKNKYENEKYHFYEMDAGTKRFPDEIRNIMDTHKIKGFDLIVASMLLLHLEKPYKLLKTLRKILNPNGHIFIRDIDDGLAIAFPDPDNILERILEISSSIKIAGFRKNGRQIYSLLKKSGFEKIKFHSESINTIGRTHDEREALFHINFAYVLNDLRVATEQFPDSTEWKSAYEWLKEEYEALEEMFQRDDFFYQMGTVVFSAGK
jgi:2-polyprenyl-3-methyl-5-hydroxy-6-metoxy-1,4-benzoquinol methylase